ncbi:MAG: PIN domain nuclease [Syntrophus sp. (in: bacteria)]|nr:PIN domain nuclease [Syntrophus sp. (in: bacteria)]MBA4418581.1 PIN domain nuclease [Syntrophus sp. (in: bacteria)]
MSAKIFVDTNILIYAHDIDSARKHEIARELVSSLWNQKTGVLSTQVLQELYVNITRKITMPIKPSEARTIVRTYMPWAIETSAETILAASEIEERNRLSFWDALIVAAASRAGAVKIVTEDLNHGQRIEGIFIENPFIT